MPPAGGETGNRNIEISFQLEAWSRQNDLGIAFDSSTGFKLPNGAEKSPDASWIKRDCWNSLNLGVAELRDEDSSTMRNRHITKLEVMN